MEEIKFSIIRSKTAQYQKENGGPGEISRCTESIKGNHREDAHGLFGELVELEEAQGMPEGQATKYQGKCCKSFLSTPGKKNFR